MLHHGLAPLQGYTDHIKPGLPAVQPVAAQKEKRCLHHLFLFARAHRLKRRAEAIVRAGFYLDKDYDPPVQENQIHLTDRTTIVTFHNPIALFRKISLRDPLAFFAQNLLLALHIYSRVRPPAP